MVHHAVYIVVRTCKQFLSNPDFNPGDCTMVFDYTAKCTKSDSGSTHRLGRHGEAFLGRELVFSRIGGDGESPGALEEGLFSRYWYLTKQRNIFLHGP
jgi:hypothetical protein